MAEYTDDRATAISKAFHDVRPPVGEEDRYGFGIGVRAGVDAVLELLANVKAKAWDEGAKSVYWADEIEHNEPHPDVLPATYAADNPYR